MADMMDEERRRQLELGRETKARIMQRHAEQTTGQPTPTQEENDRAALGEHVMVHEPDGSAPDPNVEQRQLEARPGGGYQTRQARGAQPQPAPKPAAG